MNLLGTVVGIDPSGRRLALVARGPGLSRSVPPVSAALRADREQARFEEAEGILREFVARHGLAGSAARLCVPASRVYTARVSFPPLRDKDLRAALEIELERLFPVPASRLLFGWRRLGKPRRGKPASLVVAAVEAGYVERWQEAAARAGLSLMSAVPSAWALASGIRDAGGPDPGGIAGVLRDAAGEVECALMSGGEPFFSAVRTGPDESAAAEGLEALASGMSSAPGGQAADSISLYVPARIAEKLPATEENTFRVVQDFERRAAQAVYSSEEPDAKTSPFDLLAAFGAASNGDRIDFMAGGEEVTGGRAIRFASMGLGILAAVLAVAWPSIVSFKARAEVAGLSAQRDAMKPVVLEVEKTLAEVEEIRGRVTSLQAYGEGRDEAVLLLKELTDRLPQRTWLTGLRVESRKVEIDGLSSAANEIFPLLSRDGRFKKVEFASPITRQPDNIERFSIRAEFSPAAEQQGGAR